MPLPDPRAANLSLSFPFGCPFICGVLPPACPAVPSLNVCGEPFWGFRQSLGGGCRRGAGGAGKKFATGHGDRVPHAADEG